MKLSTLAILSIFVDVRLSIVSAFVPTQTVGNPHLSQRYAANLPLPLPPPLVPQSPLPDTAIRSARGGGIVDLRYSEFLHMVQDNQLEKVTFSRSGNQLLGVAKDGIRVKLDTLPNDPDLLTQLTDHKVDVTVLPVEEAKSLLESLVSLVVPFGKCNIFVLFEIMNILTTVHFTTIIQLCFSFFNNALLCD